MIETVPLSIARGIPLRDEPGLGALTAPRFLREVTERFAGREALVMQGPNGVDRWTYAMLWERAIEVARALCACGIGKDGRVGILMTNRPEWVSSWFGVALAGGVPVALSTFSTAPELEYLLKATSVSILLLERRVLKKDFASLLCELDPAIGAAARGDLASPKFPFLRRVVSLDDGSTDDFESWRTFLGHAHTVARELVEAMSRSAHPSDLAALFLSSGSTDRPKGILSSHRAVTIQCWRWRRILGLGDDVRAWTANGFIWSGNFTSTLGATLAAGGSVVLQRTFDPVEALQLIESERVTLAQAWPHQWAQLESAPNWRGVDLSSLHYVDPSRPVARHPTVRASGWTEPSCSYGNTETFTLSASFPSGSPSEVTGGSHGVPLPGNTIKIVDPDTGTVVARGVRGEIAVKGPTLMMGYLGVPLEETLDEEGFFPTGDGGYIDAVGRLFFEGRLTDIIKTGGANVSPMEVDGALTACPGVKIGKTVGVPHETLGEMVVCCVVAHAEAVLDERTVRDFLRERLASYKLPRRVVFVREAELALTGSSKIKSNALREVVARRFAAEANDAAGTAPG